MISSRILPPENILTKEILFYWIWFAVFGKTNRSLYSDVLTYAESRLTGDNKRQKFLKSAQPN